MRKMRQDSKFGLIGLVLASALCAAGPTLAADSDKVFAGDWSWMEKVSRANAAEIQAGKLAAGKATNKSVREFAEHMVADHSKAGDELKEIASRKGVKLPDEPDRSHKREFSKLEKLTPGTRFDQEYMARAGMIDHQDAVKLFKYGATNLKDPEIKAFAEKTLPTIQQHYDMAKKTAM